MQTRRELLTLALAGPLFVRHARAADEPRFALGIASGQPHASGMVLWTRLSGAALPGQVDVRWQVAHDEAFTRIAAQGVETALAADAHSVHAEVAGLDAARWYWYRFEALGQRSTVGRTRTAPAADAPAAPLRFITASCQRWDVGYYAAWQHAVAESPDLVLFLGDYIYEYGADKGALRPAWGLVHTLADYRERYALHKSDAMLQAAHAACPWLFVWDDHEVANDYAALQGQYLDTNFAARRAAAYQAYWEHMPLPKAARPVNLAAGGQMRMYGRLDWGRLARVHLLDDRQMRDVQACPKAGLGGSRTVRLKDCPELLDSRRTLLGAEQERWLADGWDSTRPWNLLAQQTLMARLTREDPAIAGGRYWTDGWDGYPSARQRLLAVVAEKKLPGAVVLGGDVHRNFVADLKLDFDRASAPVIASEFCGTSITSLSGPQAALDAMLPFNPHILLARSDRRGYMRFDLNDKQLQVQLRTLDDARDPASAIQTLARFVVELGHPGPQRA